MRPRTLVLLAVCCALLAWCGASCDAARKGPKAKTRGSANGSATTGPVVRRSPGSIVVFDTGDDVRNESLRVQKTGGCW